MKTDKLVLHALTEIICNPVHDESKLTHYFSSDYQQTVNGHHLDLSGFIAHMKLLKTATKNMTLTFLASAARDNNVFTHHHVVANKISGEVASFEVFANFTVSNNKISSCKELTRMIKGSDSDKDFGSRH